LKKEDGAVDWRRPAEAIRNQVRGLAPWPKTHTFWQRAGGEPLRLILEKVRVEPTREGEAPAEPGVAVEASASRLVIASGDGRLAIEALQPAGKRVLSTDEFLRGYGVKPGDRFA
jgi:methionyl-tRNA formyltransferase